MNNSLPAMLIGVLALGGVVFLLFRGPLVEQVQVPTAEPAVGAVSSPEVSSPFLCVNGVCQYYYRTTMSNASTSCSFKAPNATTTLAAAAAYMRLSSGATFTAEWGNSTSPNATTTLITRLLAFGAGQTITATSTTLNALTDNIIAPNTYINFKVGSSSPTVTGTCNAVLRAIY